MSIRQIHVLMVGDRLEQRGGIATLQRLHLASAPARVRTTHVGTHDEGSYLFRTSLFVWALGRILKQLRAGDVDVVHVHQSGGGSLVRKALVVRLARRHDVPVVLHGHAGRSDSTLEGMPKALASFVTRSFLTVDAAIALSESWATWYRERLGIPVDKVFVVHNPAPPRLDGKPTDPSSSAMRIVSVSRLRPEKGTFDLLNAFSALPSGLRERCELVLAGDGDLTGTRAYAERLGISDQLVLPGWLEGDELHALLTSAGIFVSASHHEGIPLSLLEAMSCGVATVSTSVGGVPEVVTDGHDGLLVEPRRPLALTRVLARLIADDDLRLSLGRRALESCAANSVDHYWAKVAQVYSAALGSERSPATPTLRPPRGVSVIVPSFNRAAWLGEALDSLVTQSVRERLDLEVIVVDNASTDDTAAVVGKIAGATMPVRVRYEYESTPGDGAARNRGLAAASHDLLAFFDDDQIASPSWLDELLDVAQRSGAALVGGSVGLLLDEPERFGPVTRRDMLREAFPYERMQPYRQDLLPGTCNLLVHRSVFDDVGLFDESLNGGSDFDFLRRARDRGYEPWYAPDALVNHRVGQYRRTSEYFRRESRRNGWGLAETTRVDEGTTRMVVECVARIGQAALVNAPMLVLARARRHHADATDREVLLWRAEGFVRRTMAGVLPRVWPQDDFLDAHQFAGHESQQIEREGAGRKAS